MRNFRSDWLEPMDDLLKILQVRAHAMCKGIAGECLVCLAALAIAQEKMAFLDKMTKDCGLHYSDSGRVT